MNKRLFVLRSLFYRWREHTAIAAGAALTSAVLVGALTLGDSVRASLQTAAAARLGLAGLVVTAGERPFRTDLADRLSAALGGVEVAPVLLLRGSVPGTDGQTYAVQAVGVDDRFWRMAPEPGAAPALEGDTFAIGDRLALQSGFGVGDAIALRVATASPIPIEASIAAADGASVLLRGRTVDVLAARRFGRFGLQANHTPAPNVFLNMSALQRRTGLEDRANLLLIAHDAALSMDRVERALREACQLDDYGLSLSELPEGRGLELTSARLFVDAPVEQAASNLGGRAVFTYFANAIEAGGASIPYSFVSAPGAAPVPDDMPDDGIVLNAWAAGDLDVAVGDEVRLSYYAVDAGNRLEERSRLFRMHGVTPTKTAAADPRLVPAFPGFADADNCRDWRPGMPIDLDRIRPRDEEYWAVWRSAPKAFVTLSAAQEMWSNRFGTATAMRFAPRDMKELTDALRARIEPSSMGLHTMEARALGRRAGEQGTDFGALFLGMSLFVVAAALSLTGLLTAFSVERRVSEIGTLQALGFELGLVRKLLAIETLTVAAIGALLGGGLGLGYRRLLLTGLRTVWRGAVGAPELTAATGSGSMAAGVAGGLLMSAVVLAITLHRQTRRAVSARQSATDAPGTESNRGSRLAAAAAVCTAVMAAALLAFKAPGQTGHDAAAVFFAAGFLLLIAALCAWYAVLSGRWCHHPVGRRSGVAAFWILALRNAARRRGRSLAVAGTLACGVFVAIAVGANRIGPPADPSARDSGTGGFALYAEAALPVLEDPGTPAGLRALGIEPDRLDGVDIVAVRVRDGDDASCLNLNRAQRPRILGVPVGALSQRGAFGFAHAPKPGQPGADVWSLLDEPQPDGAIPAVADHTVIVWQLGLRPGDTIDVTDEGGRIVKLRLVASLANSILQGSLIVSDKQFQRLFVSEPGYRVFLVDGPHAGDERVRRLLISRLAEFGIGITPTADRLGMFNEVENTYLSMFLGLGGLGLVLGAAGLGIVLARNALDRRHELAILSAVGFRKRLIIELLTAEHVMLLAAGLLAGVVAALTAVAPAMAEHVRGMPVKAILLLLLAMAGSGLVGIVVCTAAALRGNLLAGLREE